MMIEVVNRQRKWPVDYERWRAFAARALGVVPANGAGVTLASSAGTETTQSAIGYCPEYRPSTTLPTLSTW